MNQESDKSIENEPDEVMPGHLTAGLSTDVGEVDEQDEVREVDPEETFSWQASEYIHHDKTKQWYIIVIVGALALAAGLAAFQQWFSIPVVIAMAAAIVVYGARAPRVLNYSLDDHGITIEGKSYPYSQFRSFAVVQDVAWHSIDLEPTQRFMPRLTILFDNDDFAVIVNLLSGYLPEVDRSPDWIERLSRYLKF